MAERELSTIAGSSLHDAIVNMSPEDFTSFQESRHRALVLYATTIAATVIILWEHVLLFRAELKTWQALLHGKVLPARLAVIAVRYLAIATVGVSLTFFFGDPADCKITIVAMYSLYTVLVAVASSVFLMRLHIIFAGHLWIMAFYYLLFFLNVAAWIVIDLGFDAYEIPSQMQWRHGGKCVPRRVPWYGALGWAANLTFDTVTLVGTWWRLRWVQKQKGARKFTNNRTHRYIWLSNVFYFSISCAFNIGCLVTELLVTSPIYSHLPSPIAFAAHSIVSCRLLLTAKDWGVLEPASEVAGAGKPSARNRSSPYQLDPRPNTAAIPVPYTVDEYVTVQEAAKIRGRVGTFIGRAGSPLSCVEEGDSVHSIVAPSGMSSSQSSRMDRLGGQSTVGIPLPRLDAVCVDNDRSDVDSTPTTSRQKLTPTRQTRTPRALTPEKEPIAWKDTPWPSSGGYNRNTSSLHWSQHPRTEQSSPESKTGTDGSRHSGPSTDALAPSAALVQDVYPHLSGRYRMLRRNEGESTTTTETESGQVKTALGGTPSVQELQQTKAGGKRTDREARPARSFSTSDSSSPFGHDFGPRQSDAHPDTPSIALRSSSLSLRSSVGSSPPTDMKQQPHSTETLDDGSGSSCHPSSGADAGECPSSSILKGHEELTLGILPVGAHSSSTGDLSVRSSVQLERSSTFGRKSVSGLDDVDE
ncbi:hypothetical protein V8E36_008635 [Tilletia maclaganii]